MTKTYLRFWKQGYSSNFDIIDIDWKIDKKEMLSDGEKYDELRYFELKEKLK